MQQEIILQIVSLCFYLGYVLTHNYWLLSFYTWLYLASIPLLVTEYVSLTDKPEK